MALAEHLQVDGEHQRAAFRAGGALDQRTAATWETTPATTRWWMALSGGVGPAPPLAPGVLAQAGLMLVQLVNEGFLVEDGEVYRVAWRYADGAMTLNDTPLPFLQR